jgi:hypothetical protein
MQIAINVSLGNLSNECGIIKIFKNESGRH